MPEMDLLLLVGVAAKNPILSTVIEELADAGFPIPIPEQKLFAMLKAPKSEGPAPAIWSVDRQTIDGDPALVVQIAGVDQGWGISVAASPCGCKTGVCYFSGADGQCLGGASSWPGLEEAVKKARLLALAHKEKQEH